MTSGAGSLWYSILKDKYFPHSSRMFAGARRGSQFWKDLIKVRPLFLDHVKFTVGDGTSIRFCRDWWCGDAPLGHRFPVLFSFCPNPEISITEVAANNWDLAFHRSLTPEELEDWQSLSAFFPCSRRRRTLLSGLILPLVGFWLSLCTRGSSEVSLQIGSLAFGGPKFLLRLKSSSGKPLEVGSPLLTKSVSVMVRARNFVLFAVVWNTRSTSSFTVYGLS